MRVTQRVIDRLTERGVELNFVNGKSPEDYTYPELINLAPGAIAVVADLVGAEFVESARAFTELGYIPDLRVLPEEDDSDYAARLGRYADARIVPVHQAGVAKAVCWNPFHRELLDPHLADRALVLASADVLDGLYTSSQPSELPEILPGERMESWIAKLISECYVRKASDIEVTALATGMRVRVHALGEWSGWIGALPLVQKAAFLRALCSMGVPSRDYDAGTVQDFKIEVRVKGVDTSWRVSILPAAMGESVTLRMLPQIGKIPRLAELGFTDQGMSLLRKAAANRDGLVLVTGATGSGKTTTLYSVIDELRLARKKCFTIEAPVELFMPGVVQVEVRDDPALDERYRLTFAGGVRTALRAKPDVIVVGETRDTDTAQAAVSAGRTGHLTFTTLHTGDVFTSVKRLQDLGIDAAALADTLRLVVSQRLAVRLCPHCRIEHRDTRQAKRGPGCPACAGVGAIGKIVVAEILYLDQQARESILAGALKAEIPRLTAKGYYISMRSSAERLIDSGVIDAQEFNFDD